MTAALQFEVKKDGFTQLQSGSYKLTLTLNPADLTDNAQSLLLDFVKAPMGERYMLAIAQIGDDEQPVAATQKPAKPKRHFRELPRSQQAALACNDVAFQKWIGVEGINGTEDDVTDAARRLRGHLGIASRAQLDKPINFDRSLAWDALYARFQEETGRVPS